MELVAKNNKYSETAPAQIDTGTRHLDQAAPSVPLPIVSFLKYKRVLIDTTHRISHGVLNTSCHVFYSVYSWTSFVQMKIWLSELYLLRHILIDLCQHLATPGDPVLGVWSRPLRHRPRSEHFSCQTSMVALLAMSRSRATSRTRQLLSFLPGDPTAAP